ncbi:EscJ/YscJ/HrcJ family type III secretion inner membrane ring protein [Pseudomonas sp. SWRI12]|uniref:Lipoprotein n=1 Tax=Pseudomonas zanjanensis TaxID=2745496 RepID=A0A923FBM7_9PSED|nr:MULTISPECIES: EscJ/YscJ/HrcJ family type III secretion inner membrane ring protein [Pseudomonas]MBC3382525.1 EscJ/YscJ/HrcJ family type III secretion inner membrane ring protein [Pseudomonas sp. SWRI179]MBV4494553.1 EscJ/YscJ/HrcJ family type III secretion inner membrane ring protein [Pseudomonas zanjanensis]
MKTSVLVLLLCLALAGCRQPNLLEGLDQQQANEVLSVLQRNNIAAVKVDTGKTGYAVKIDALDFSAAVDLLNLYSLPSRPRLQVSEMFPADSLVASPRAEKARLYSALEQRIEQSLGVLEGVVSARVHVSYDLDAGEGGRKSPPVHLSAVVLHERDVEPQLLITDIKRFLKNSFATVEYENVSVVLSKRSATQHVAPSVAVTRGHSPWPWWLAAISAVLLAGGGAWVYRQSSAGRRDVGA